MQYVFAALDLWQSFGIDTRMSGTGWQMSVQGVIWRILPDDTEVQQYDMMVEGHGAPYLKTWNFMMH